MSRGRLRLQLAESGKTIFWAIANCFVQQPAAENEKNNFLVFKVFIG